MNKGAFRHFDNENEARVKEYFDWAEEHPDGYVVDYKKQDKDGKYIYHKPDCNHIASKTCSYLKKPKVGFADVKALTEWLAMKKSRPCEGFCKGKGLPASLG